MPFQLPFILGHRGARAVLMENTLPSFEYACKNGVQWVELDTMLSKDNVPMVFHDETLDRLCSVKGRLDSFTCQQLQSFELTGGYQIPTLAEVLDLLNTCKTNVNIEIKPSSSTFSIKTARLAYQVAYEKGFDTAERLLFSSFDWGALEEATLVAPHIPVGVLVEDISGDWRPVAKKLNAFSINYGADLLSDSLIAEILENYYLLAYTVNDISQARSLKAKGVNAIFTDIPVDMMTAFK